MTQRTYLDDLADRIRRETPDEMLPDDASGAELDQLFRLYALLALIQGSSVTPANVHDAWSTWMLNRGREHDSIVPFTSLDDHAQEQDDPYVRAIRAALSS
jgi:hypothetical protein